MCTVSRYLNQKLFFECYIIVSPWFGSMVVPTKSTFLVLNCVMFNLKELTKFKFSYLKQLCAPLYRVSSLTLYLIFKFKSS